MDLFKDYPVYKGTDLGVTYAANKSVFKVWAPKATSVLLKLYESGNGSDLFSTIEFEKSRKGVWQGTVKGNLKNQYYTLQVLQDGIWLQERPDIYAKAVGINGQRGMVVDLPSTNPTGWEKDRKPVVKNPTDIIIYELHVRDLSMDPNSGIVAEGKFLGLTETGIKTGGGETTGLDHIKELGVTHVHLLPCFDFDSVDESKPGANQYNWGYDPANYNVPEGSYASDPYDGIVRIAEFKQMVKTLHENGLGVIMDVVYNHTSSIESNFNQFAPLYYYRLNENGAYSNGSGCGNETASERPMMRKFIIDSVKYWATEYHIDGFRFDLMGLHDIETMKEISSALHRIDPSLFIYGEGWTGGETPLPEKQRAIKSNTFKLKRIAAFNDDLRDALKGPFGNVHAAGFASGQTGYKESVKFGIVAATKHSQINYKQVNHSKEPWAHEPTQTINYVSCHDDHTLYDRIKISNPNASEKELIKIDRLCNTVILTSHGVSFLHAGVEMLRTKQGIANSYQSPDYINQIDWRRKEQYKDVFNYYKALVALRKNHPAFRMSSTRMIQKHLRFLDTNDDCLVAYRISGNANNDGWKNILVILNGRNYTNKVKIPKGTWRLVCDGEQINEDGIASVDGPEIDIPGTAAFVLYK